MVINLKVKLTKPDELKLFAEEFLEYLRTVAIAASPALKEHAEQETSYLVEIRDLITIAEKVDESGLDPKINYTKGPLTS